MKPWIDTILYYNLFIASNKFRNYFGLVYKAMVQVAMHKLSIFNGLTNAPYI